MGLALSKHAESFCLEKHCQSWTLETLSPKERDVRYLKTYDFYTHFGFQLLLELRPYSLDFAMVYLQKPLKKDNKLS